MKYHIIADESVDGRNIDQLRKNNFQVYSISEQSPSAQDSFVLNLAFNHDALLITEDKDFGDLVFRLKLKHKGILLVKISEAQQKIPLVVAAISKHYPEMLNKFSVIDSKKIRIKE